MSGALFYPEDGVVNKRKFLRSYNLLSSGEREEEKINALATVLSLLPCPQPASTSTSSSTLGSHPTPNTSKTAQAKVSTKGLLNGVSQSTLS